MHSKFTWTGSSSSTILGIRELETLGYRLHYHVMVGHYMYLISLVDIRTSEIDVDVPFTSQLTIRQNAFLNVFEYNVVCNVTDDVGQSV